MHMQDFANAIPRRVLRRARKCPSQAMRWSGSAALAFFSLIFIAAPADGQTQPSVADLPARIAIPAGQPIPVALDSTISTINSKRGQIVTFRMLYSMPLGDGLEIPPQTQILGHVVDLQRPAHFSREGELRLAVDEIRLHPDGGATIAAHLDSDEMKGEGRFTNDNPHPADLHPVVIQSAGGAVLGAASAGASGAGIGAGTGAALAVLILKSPRGQDVYLEQGMRFAVILDEPAYVSIAAVRAAQQEFNSRPRPASPEPNSQNGSPQLKRRPAPRQ